MSHPPADYRWLAGTYAFWEGLLFGNNLQRCRLEFREELRKAESVLLLGDGDGRFSTRLLETFPNLKITSLDASKAMLKAAARRRIRSGMERRPIRSLKQDILYWEAPEASFDAVVAQFFFDSFNTEEMNRIAFKIHGFLKPSARLYRVRIFDTLQTRRGTHRAKLTLWFLYKLFRILTGLKTQALVDYEACLNRAGMKRNRRRDFMHGTLTTRVYVKA